MQKMSSSTRETEVKLPFPSPDAALAALERAGGRLRRSRTFERNRVYDRPDGSLARRGCLLRVREFGDRSTMTFKSPVPGDHLHKVREEHETEIEDAGALSLILESLGFLVSWRYEKFRTILDVGEDVEAAIDETPIGCWVELEGEPGAIDRVAGSLGFGADAYVRETYRELLESHSAARGLPAGDLTFDGAP